MQDEFSEERVGDGYTSVDYQFAALMDLPGDPDMLRLSRNLRHKKNLSDTQRYRLDKHIQQAFIGIFPAVRDEIGFDAA